MAAKNKMADSGHIFFKTVKALNIICLVICIYQNGSIHLYKLDFVFENLDFFCLREPSSPLKHITIWNIVRRKIMHIYFKAVCVTCSRVIDMFDGRIFLGHLGYTRILYRNESVPDNRSRKPAEAVALVKFYFVKMINVFYIRDQGFV